MKKILVWLIVFSLFTPLAWAYTEHNVQSANFLATKGVINNNASQISAYNLDGTITRREMLKVMINLSGKSLPATCSGKFSDLKSSDWGCRYAEAALANNFIAANASYRPNDTVTQIEALKMIMQAKWIDKNANTDWRAGYVSAAQDEGILVEDYLEYNSLAYRGWIFSTSARSYADFTYTQADVELTPEEEELFNYLLDL